MSAASIDQTHGRAQILNGTVYYSPNCTRLLGSSPEPAADFPSQNIFLPSLGRYSDRPRKPTEGPVGNPPGNSASGSGPSSHSSASYDLHDFSQVFLGDYQRPRWWSHRWGWTAFIPRGPCVDGGIFDALSQTPKPSRHRGGFRLPEAIISRLSSLETDICRAAHLLAQRLSVSLTFPALPWVLGYRKIHPTSTAAVESFKRSRDWYLVWIGLLSYLIAVCETEECDLKNSTNLSNVNWLSYLTAHGCRPTWIDDLRSSVVCSFASSTPRSGLFVNLPATHPMQPAIEWLCRFGIPVWYPWGQEQCRDVKLAAYAPPTHQLQDALSSISQSIGPAGIPNNGAGITETEGRLDNGISWRQFFTTREEHNRKIISLENPVDSQRRLNRESNPPTRKAKVFEWRKDHRGLLIREPISGKYKIETLASYAKDQIKYDAVRNEYDCCEEFGPEEGFIQIIAHDDEIDISPAVLAGCHVMEKENHDVLNLELLPSWSEASQKSDYDGGLGCDDIDWIPTSQFETRGPTSAIQDIFVEEVLETARLWFGYIPSSPPAGLGLPAQNSQRTILKIFGFAWRDDVIEAFKQPCMSALADFLRRLGSNHPISPLDWDLGESHIQSLTFHRRFSYLRELKTGSSTLYMFNFGNESREKWNLTMTSASHALLVCRLDPRFSLLEITRYLLQHGIPFHTLQHSPSLHRAPLVVRPPHKCPIRLPGYIFTHEDYRSYRERCNEMLKQSRARAALMMGGYMWRIAVPVVSFDDVISGPTGLSTNRDEMFIVTDSDTGEEYVDDQLTSHEIDILTGLNICLTEYGGQTAKRSWYPHPKTFRHSGQDYGHWTSLSENLFKVTARGKDIVTAGAEIKQPVAIHKWRDLIRGSGDMRRINLALDGKSRHFIHTHGSSYGPLRLLEHRRQIA